MAPGVSARARSYWPSQSIRSHGDGGREHFWLRGSSRRSGGEAGGRLRRGRSGNGTAVALYRRAGFQPVERFELHPGTESLLMQWTAGPPART